MKKIEGLHNKTQVIEAENLLYNNKNILINEEDLRRIFKKSGLEGVEYRNINLYRTAFVHKSYCTMKNLDFEKSNINCPSDCLPLQDMSYERLEFLGDSILGMVVTNYLYNRFPDQNEGFLSKMKTKIVNGKMLGYLSREIGLDKFAIISKQVEEAGGRDNYKIMEDIFEAFIGSLFLDFQEDSVKLPMKLEALSGYGYYIVEQFIIYIIENYIDMSELIRTKNNYKDMLVSHMLNHIQDTPRFYELNVISKNNSRVFTYCVKDRNNTILATSTGGTKKDAENNVAKEALKFYGVEVM